MFKILSPKNQIKGMPECLDLIVKGGYGAFCIKRIFEVLVSNYPEKVLCDFMDDVIIQVIINLRPYSEEWFMQSLVEVPQAVLNNGEKTSFITNLREKEYEANKEYYIDFFDKFYRRCKTYNSKIY